mgnify:FL=1
MPAYGLYSADQFVTTSGSRADCGALPQALWYFATETIAVPQPGTPVAGFERALPVWDDLAAWARATPFDAVPVLPPLVWLGAPDSVTGAQLAGDGRTIRSGGEDLALQLAPRLPLNSAWFDANSLAFFRGRPLKMRGNRQGEAFVARTFWPEDFRLPEAPPGVALAGDPSALRAWVRAQPQGDRKSVV